MSSLFSTDENIESSPAIVGYRILKDMKKRGQTKASIFDIADSLVGERWFDPTHMHYGLIFLFSVGLIELDGSYVVQNAA